MYLCIQGNPSFDRSICHWVDISETPQQSPLKSNKSKTKHIFFTKHRSREHDQLDFTLVKTVMLQKIP